mmetsp:Transcript_5799/g.19535  ORF Transcript_5799/g.19535 Transcript_5799/m.19535 type:complete len:370 (+) Transcript_5799:322-1431(+)
MSSPMTMVSAASIVVDTSEQRKSMETSGSSETARMPLSLPLAASRNAALTSSAVTFLEVCTTRSTTETFGVGTRSAIPLSLPLSWGRTRDTALAAPVEVGTMFKAAARARRKSRWDASKMRWSPVYEWQVVIVPLTMPNLSSRTLANGAKQFVVHDALDTIVADGSYWSALTPTTYVGMSDPLAGAVMTTFLAPAWMCLPAPGPSRKTPVPSMTISMPISFHGKFNGSRSDTTLMTSPSTEMVESSITLTSDLNVPKMESYLSKCAAGLAPPDWFTHTTWSGQSGPRDFQQRTKLRPMRPKPLIATLILASVTTATDALDAARGVTAWRKPWDWAPPAMDLADFKPVNSTVLIADMVVRDECVYVSQDC